MESYDRRYAGWPREIEPEGIHRVHVHSTRGKGNNVAESLRKKQGSRRDSPDLDAGKALASEKPVGRTGGNSAGKSERTRQSCRVSRRSDRNAVRGSAGVSGRETAERCLRGSYYFLARRGDQGGEVQKKLTGPSERQDAGAPSDGWQRLLKVKKSKIYLSAKGEKRMQQNN